MALSDSLTTSGSGNYALYYSTLTFSWSATQNIAQNKSTVSWVLNVSTGAGTYFSRYVKVDGAVKYGYGVPYQNYSPTGEYYYSGTQLASGSFDVYHNPDGTGSFSVDIGACIQYSYWYMNPSYRAYGQSDTGNWNSRGSKTFTLDTIPRNASTVDSVSISNSQISGYIVAGYSTSTLSVSTTLGDAPSISKYVVMQGNTVLYNDVSQPSFTVPNITGTDASITYKVYVIDSYGMTSNTFTCTAFTAYKYTPGSFTTSPLSQRCFNDGTPDETGQYALCEIEFSNSKIGTNDITTTCIATVNNDSSDPSSSPMSEVVGNNTLSGASSYTVVYSLSDAIKSDFETSTDTISVSFRTMNFSGDGKGVGIGQLGVSGYHDVNNMEFRLNDGVSYGQMSAGFITGNHQDHGLYSYGYVDSNDTFHSDPKWLIKRNNTGDIEIGGMTVTTYNDKVTNGSKTFSQTLSVCGKIAMLTLVITGDGSTIAYRGNYFTASLDAGFRPISDVIVMSNWYEHIARATLTTNGSIEIKNISGGSSAFNNGDTDLVVTFTYIIA